MYDPITSALISSSPALSGLDLDDLPKRLAEAYAEVVASRISLRSPDGGTPERLAATLSMLRRLAIAHEAHVALLPDRENRRAAAFVAGSSHQAILLARQQGEIGFSVIRAGEIIGEHEVIFALDNEVISIKHKAQNRDCFAEGAVAAAIWLASQKPGLYSMQDFIAAQ